MENRFKVCSKCEISKHFSEFYKSSKFLFGIHTWCKECMNKYSNEYNSKHRDECRKRSKEWRKNNLERSREMVRKWHSTHKEYMRQWRIDNKEKLKIFAKRAKEKKDLEKCKAALHG